MFSGIFAKFTKFSAGSRRHSWKTQFCNSYKMIFTRKVMQKLLAKLERCRILQYLGMFKLSFFASFQ